MNLRSKFPGILLAALMMVPMILTARENPKLKSYIAERVVGKAPVIDGKLNDKAWSEAKWGDDFYQFRPYNGKKATQKTDFKILYDDNNLYVAIRCYDTEPNKIARRLTRRDHIDGDWAGIAIDSHFDRRSAYGFFVSEAGVKYDGKFSNDNGNSDRTWNPIWYVKTSKDSKGWVAEMRIPLSQLRFAKQKNMTWGLELIRYIYRNQEKDFWQPVYQDASGFVSHFGLLKGIHNIKPKREVFLAPYVMSKLTTAPITAGDPFSKARTASVSAGLDGTIAVTNDLTMNFTINPDFGEVNADPSQVNLSAFESYFSELRPFFVEGSNIFNFPIVAGNNNNAQNLFYSRRIGRAPQYSPDLADSEYIKSPKVTKILGACKLSGKTEKGWSIGIMDAVGNREMASIDSLGKRSKIAVEPLTNYFNARLQKRFNNGNTYLGGMVTATNRSIQDTSLLFLPKAAYTAGINFRNYWNNHVYQLSANVLASSVSGGTKAITDLQENSRRYYQRPGNARQVDSSLRVLQGTSASVDFRKIGEGHWRYGVQGYMESPGLDLNDQGYLRLTDVIQGYSWLQYDIWEPFGIFNNLYFGLNSWVKWNFAGQETFSGESLSTWGQFKNYWHASFDVQHRGFELKWSELRGGPAIIFPGHWSYHIHLSTDSHKKLSFSSYFGRAIYDQNAGTALHMYLGINYQPLDFLSISLTPNLYQSNEGVIYVNDEQVKNKDLYIVSNLFQKQVSANFRVNLSFTPDLSLEYWGQPFLFSANYYGYKRVSNPGQKNFSSQFYQYSGNQIVFDAGNNQYMIHDPTTPGSTFTLDNPNFSVVEFRSNMVLRWEFVPGSTLYFVWSQSNDNSTSQGIFNFTDNLQTLVDTKPTNIFLVKFSYQIKI